MRNKALELVINAVKELNEELEYETLEDPSESTIIFGGEEGIDSLSLVSLVVSLESESESVFGQKILLTDEKAMSQRNSPFRSVGALTDFIVSRKEELDHS